MVRLDLSYRWTTGYVAGDKIYCVHEAAEVETSLEHARGGGLPADLVDPVTEQVCPDFPAQTVHREASWPVADEPYPVKEAA